ncbi:MAG: CPBP family intramembrane metalloprotease [Spirochaetia bacterium]|nr:CPBP family intramembrane metalloprotease [Spirochaetia bacterium]
MQTTSSLKNLFRPVPFFGIDFLLTWIPLWLMAAGLQSGWFKSGIGLLVLAGCSSTLAAMVFVHRTGHRGFIKDFWIRVVDPFRISPVWWITIFLSQGAVNVLAILLSSQGSGGLEQLSLSQQFLAAPVGFIVFTLLFGPLPEELGWRGYGLDALRSRMNLFKASLLLASIWAVWHLPMVFIPGSFQNNLLQKPLVLAAFFAAFVPGSILMSWIYYRTRRSTLSAILFHFAGNLSGEIFSMDMETRIIQTVLLTLWAAIVLWREWPMFTEKEFWLNFPDSDPKTKKRRPVYLAGGLYLPVLALMLCVPAQLKADSSWETVPLPYLFYTSDTGVAGGGILTAIHTSQLPSAEVATEDLNLAVSATRTQKNQTEVNISGEKQCFDNRLLWVGDFRYSDFPSEFYGVGPDSTQAEEFSAEGLELEIALLGRTGPSMRIGPVLRLGVSELSEFSPGGELEELRSHRELDGSFSGAGLLLRLDSRSNPRYPATGSLIEVQSTLFMEHRRFYHNFLQTKMDIRTYRSLREEVIAAFRFSAVLNSGEPPLQQMAEQGGLFCMRGLPAGRYRDRNGFTGQAELRFPLVRRIKGVLFGAAGTVSSSLYSLKDIHFEDVKFSGGAGLRFPLNSRGDINLRIDYGLASGSNGLYITLMEAF